MNRSSVNLAVLASILFVVSHKTQSFAGEELPAGATRRIHVELDAGKEGLASLAAFSDGNRIAFGTTDGRVVIYDVKQKKITRQFGDRKSYVERVAVSPNGKRLAWVRDFEPVAVVDLSSGKEYKCPVDTEQVFIERLSFSPDGNRLAVLDDEAGAFVWSIGSATHWKSPQRATTIGFFPDGKTVAVGFNSVRLLKPESGDLIRELSSVEGLVGGFAFLPSGRLAATDGSCRGSKLRIWDVKSGEQLAAHKLDRAHSTGDPLVQSPDGQVLVLTGHQRMQFLETKTGQILATKSFRKRGSRRLAFIDSGRSFITIREGDSDATIWDTAHVLGRALPLDENAR
ncbi:MAG: WD40 repeat domain-containing protein [Planctomycetes bacterium]|nr:WD40 repeat domain-containing protein [Planctomycetota bacterium]